MSEVSDAMGDGTPPSVAAEAETTEPFDFEAHGRAAAEKYRLIHGTYADCSAAVRSVLGTALEQEKIQVSSLEHRAKTVESFQEKARRPSEANSEAAQYPNPMHDITDLSGVRVVAFLLSTVPKVNAEVEQQFDVLEKSGKSGLLEEEQKLGYQSVHYLVQFSEERVGLPEYKTFRGLTTEIQVRTIPQHAWAEIEHDIQYKAVETIPRSIRNRFTQLAGALAIADREFQSVSDEDEQARTGARKLIEKGQLDRVEITPDALRLYLNRKYGSDGRMSDWSYGWTARLVNRLDFETLGELEACIDGYNDDRISRLLYGSRQGQLSRFESVLLAAVGEEYVKRHPFSGGEYADTWRERWGKQLATLAAAGITPREGSSPSD